MVRMVFLPFEESSFTTFARSASGLLLAYFLQFLLRKIEFSVFTPISSKRWHPIAFYDMYVINPDIIFLIVCTENHPDKKRKLGNCLTEALKLVLLIGILFLFLFIFCFSKHIQVGFGIRCAILNLDRTAN